MPAEIAALELEQEKLVAELSSADFYTERASERTAIETKLKKLEENMANRFARWEALEAKKG